MLAIDLIGTLTQRGDSPLRLLKTALCLSLLALVAGPASAVVISEIDYDQPSTDAAEWLELHNPSASPESLVGLDVVFINGSNGNCTEYNRYGLDAITIPAGGFVVIGNHPCADTSITLNATNAIQNGAPDGIMIELRSDGSIVDGVEYENTGVANCGGVAVATGDNSTAGISLQLCGGIWAAEPFTPCGPPACGPVAIEDMTWGSVKSNF